MKHDNQYKVSRKHDRDEHVQRVEGLLGDIFSRSFQQPWPLALWNASLNGGKAAGSASAWLTAAGAQ